LNVISTKKTSSEQPGKLPKFTVVLRLARVLQKFMYRLTAIRDLKIQWKE